MVMGVMSVTSSKVALGVEEAAKEHRSLTLEESWLEADLRGMAT